MGRTHSRISMPTAMISSIKGLLPTKCMVIRVESIPGCL